MVIPDPGYFVSSLLSLTEKGLNYCLHYVHLRLQPDQVKNNDN